MLKDREIRKRQLNVIQNDAPIVDYRVALKDQYSICSHCGKKYQNYDAVLARGDNERT